MSLDKKVKLTPLMKQYNQIKVKYPDALLLFRVGDFYETFGKDAIKASKIAVNFLLEILFSVSFEKFVFFL